MSTWYEITPADTLFFRGTEPLEAGLPVAQPLFPPPVSVIQGAVRTTVLLQHNVSFTDYKAGRCPDDLTAQIGKCGEPAPFNVITLAFALDDTWYVAAPASWYVDLTEKKGIKPVCGANFTGLSVTAFTPDKANQNPLNLCTSAGPNLPLLPLADPFSMAGFWLRRDRLLETTPAPLQEKEVLAPKEIYDIEPRTGIAMDNRRKVIQGQLYSACHVRLRAGVRLVVGLDTAPGLDSQGTIQLGGERRMCTYRSVPAPEHPGDEGRIFMTPAPVIMTEEIIPDICCAGAPFTIAGWDLSKGFHKPTTTWLPAGSVFYKNINSHCIPLA
ncbi:type III-B CRISPR module-associated Cmr3 family protein [Desulfobacter sp.]|uniref:type III-B CRISPR module-associated Cmr3 family protein n=1 Tax=Desulfobacter sp. TaxID=2294 RepID=UPI00257B4C47|nr:type III-B CRISPR module-associated Cmr3 family protein [Desulfobacter sp.]